jgi:hypothetical protein
MKRIHLLTLLLVSFGLTVSAAADGPRKIAGLELGGYLSDHKSRVDMESLLPLRNNRYLHEVETLPDENFESGLIWIANCAEPGRIVRIKLKYTDASRKFYDELLKRFKQSFGEPDEWRGDPFRIVIAWKWSFKDPVVGRISMILQHNTRDKEESIGNSVKLTTWDLIDAERQCWQKKSAQKKRELEVKRSGPSDWDQLIPR